MAEARVRHSITRMRLGSNAAEPSARSRLIRALTSRVAFLVYGFVIGVVLALVWKGP
jgi:hypothetical protein